jgi:hypothetical protein
MNAAAFQGPLRWSCAGPASGLWPSTQPTTAAQRWSRDPANSCKASALAARKPDFNSRSSGG